MRRITLFLIIALAFFLSACGSDDNDNFEAGNIARVRYLNADPNSNRFEITRTIDEQVIQDEIDGLSLGEATAFESIEPGSVELRFVDEEQPFFDEPFTFSLGGGNASTLIFFQDSLRIVISNNNNEEELGPFSRLRFANFFLSSQPVDIFLLNPGSDPTTTEPIFIGSEPGEISDFLVVRNTSFNVFVTVSGTDTVLMQEGPFELNDGENFTAYLFGDLQGRFGSGINILED